MIANRKYEEAREWIKRAAKWNKKDASNILADLELIIARNEMKVIASSHPDESTPPNKTTGVNSADDATERKEESEKLVCNNDDSNHEQIEKGLESMDKEENLTILDIFRHRQLLIASLLMWIIW